MGAPVLARAAAAAFVESARRSGRRVVLAGGVFDVLHPGHVRYLEAAAAEGHELVVALNGDASAGARKGPGRPVQAAEARAEVVAALRAVSAVTVFHEDDLCATIRALRPDVVAKGNDWSAERLPAAERDACAEVGARLAFVGGDKTGSSTEVLARARLAQAAPAAPGKPA